MILRAIGVTGLTLFAAQSQAPPPTPPTSPFAAAAITRDDAAGDDGTGTPVRLTFAWPAGMTATINAERSKTMVSPDGRKTTGGALRYRMRVAAHADGRLIEYDSFEPIGVTLDASEQAALIDVLSSLMPSLIVTKAGEFVRVGDLSPLRQAVRQIVDTARTKTPADAVPPTLQAMLDGLSSEEVLSQLAAAEWQSFAGAFVGFEGTVGKMKQWDSDEPSPVIPGLTIPMRTTFGALRRLPCEAGRSSDSCVLMEVRSAVAPGAMQVIVKRLLEGMKGAEGLTYDRFNVTTELQSTLEPSTMRPYLIAQTKTADFAATMPGKGSSSALMTERRTYRITYQTR